MRRSPRVKQEVRLRATFLGRLRAGLVLAGSGWLIWPHNPGLFNAAGGCTEFHFPPMKGEARRQIARGLSEAANV